MAAASSIISSTWQRLDRNHQRTTVKVASGDFGEVFVGSLEAPTPQGSIIVDGKGSALQTEKQLTLSGNASLTISDHAAVSVLGAGGSMTVLGSADGPATVDVSGGSTLKVNGPLMVLPGGKVTVDATSKVSVGSGAFGPPGSLYVTKGGTLGGNPDEIDANVMVASGGSLAPAAGAGSLTIHGNYTENGRIAFPGHACRRDPGYRLRSAACHRHGDGRRDLGGEAGARLYARAPGRHSPFYRRER